MVYEYPDENDDLTVKFLAEFEKSAQYWDQSESFIIELIKKHISSSNFIGIKRFLDAGCGSGRLIPRFESKFEEIVAIEPDEQRIKNATELIQYLGIKSKTEFYCTLAQEFKSDSKFDFILSSHVIQHIHTQSVLPLLKNLRDHLNETGILAITTCHSEQNTDYFTKNYVRNGKPVIELTDEVNYNRLVNGKGLLPIHFFKSSDLIMKLNEIGLELIDFRVFHVDITDRDRMQEKDIDAYVNETKQRQDSYGRDMCLVLRKCLKCLE